MTIQYLKENNTTLKVVETKETESSYLLKNLIQNKEDLIVMKNNSLAQKQAEADRFDILINDIDKKITEAKKLGIVEKEGAIE